MPVNWLDKLHASAPSPALSLFYGNPDKKHLFFFFTNLRSGPIWAVLIHSLFVSSCPPECNFQSETKIEPDLRLFFTWSNHKAMDKLRFKETNCFTHWIWDLSSGWHNLYFEQLGQKFSVFKIYVLAFWLFFDKYWSERSLKEEQRENHTEFFTRTNYARCTYSAAYSDTCGGFI